MPARPLVSVTIPVYNGEAHLRETLASCLDQTLSDFEIVAVDDASTDASWAILEEAARRDPRLRIERHAVNRGHRACSNTAFALARGRYLARCDQDDLSLPRRLEIQVEALEHDPEVVLVGSAYRRLLPDGTASTHRPPGDHSTLRWRLLFDLPFPHSSLMMRREPLFTGVGPYRYAPAAYDYEVTARLARVGRVAAVGEPLVVYRIHEAGLSTTSFEAMTTAAAAISAREIRRLFAGRRLRRNDVSSLRRLGSGRRIERGDLSRLPLAIELLRAFAAQPDIDPGALPAIRRRWVRRLGAAAAAAPGALLAPRTFALLLRLHAGQALLAGARAAAALPLGLRRPAVK